MLSGHILKERLLVGNHTDYTVFTVNILPILP